MKTRSILLALLMMAGTSLFAQSDCHLITDRDTDTGHLKAIKRSSLVEITDLSIGLMLQNFSGSLMMIFDATVGAKRVKKDFDKGTQSTISFMLANGNKVSFDINEPKKGSGARLQSWGNYELGGIIDVRKGQIDSLQQSPINKVFFTFYGLPADTLTTANKDYFVKNLPCLK